MPHAAANAGNGAIAVVTVAIAPSAREPVHTHAFDLVLVALTPGRMEVRVGEDVGARDYAVGEVIFVPRDVPHHQQRRAGDEDDQVSRRPGCMRGRCVPFGGVGLLHVRFVRCGELERHRDAMARFRSGLKAVEAVGQTLT